MFQCVAVVTYVLGLATSLKGVISSIGTSGPEYDGADSEVEGGSYIIGGIYEA